MKNNKIGSTYINADYYDTTMPIIALSDNACLLGWEHESGNWSYELRSKVPSNRTIVNDRHVKGEEPSIVLDKLLYWARNKSGADQQDLERKLKNLEEDIAAIYPTAHPWTEWKGYE